MTIATIFGVFEWEFYWRRNLSQESYGEINEQMQSFLEVGLKAR